jgi:hypothetical protein
MADATFFVSLRSDQIKKIKTPLTFQVISNGKVLDEVKTNFMGPVKN